LIGFLKSISTVIKKHIKWQNCYLMSKINVLHYLQTIIEGLDKIDSSELEDLEEYLSRFLQHDTHPLDKKIVNYLFLGYYITEYVVPSLRLERGELGVNSENPECDTQDLESATPC